MTTTDRVVTFGEAIRETLHLAAARDPGVFLMGQGISDPSSFWGTTKGVVGDDEAHRTLDVPVAEAGMIGMAIGAAIAGQRPIVSLHRVEFALLAFEQIVNNAAKAHYVTNGQHTVPLVLRMVVGRGWGQGPAHSQSIEAVWAHFPGLKVVMPSLPADGKGLLAAAIEDDSPVVYLENRWLHNVTGHVPEGWYTNALDGPRVVTPGSDVTVVATSYMTLEAMKAADLLAGIGCSVEVIDLRVVRPLVTDPIVESVSRTGRLVTVDSGFVQLGVGAEIVARVVSEAFGSLQAAPVRLGLPDHPTPSSRGMIPGYYPDAGSIVDAVATVAGIASSDLTGIHETLEAEHRTSPIDVPDPSFKGPF